MAERKGYLSLGIPKEAKKERNLPTKQVERAKSDCKRRVRQNSIALAESSPLVLLIEGL